MADMLVRDLSAELVARLKKRAESKGRSLQAEVKYLLIEAARPEPELFRRLASKRRKRLAAGGRKFTDSVADLRADRDR